MNLDFAPTFTPPLLLKDFDLGFEAARGARRADAGRRRGPQVRAGAGGDGYTDVDFAALIELEARASGLEPPTPRTCQTSPTTA